MAFGIIIFIIGRRHQDLFIGTAFQVMDAVIDQDISLKQVLTEAQTRLGRKPETVGIWIGPEGGFAPEEAKKLEEAGCATAGLGSRILRCETAGMMACAMILYHYDEM